MRMRLSSNLVFASLFSSGAALAPAFAAPPLHRWQGPAPSHFGQSVDGAGDVNGDGRGDVLVGSPDASIFDPHLEMRSGADGAVLWAAYDTANGLPGGRNLMTRLGISVAGVGDLDGDGVADVAAGAHADGREAYRSGSVRAYSGADGRLLWEAFGEAAYDEMGYRVAAAGDVNLDGVDDVVAGCLTPLSLPRYVAVLSGADGSFLFLLRETAAPDAIGQYTNFGSDVAGVGDVNSDGFPDLAVGATHDDRNGVDAGSVTIFSGRSGAPVYSVFGDGVGDLLGISVDRVGDLNGDGRAEFVAGATAVTGPRGVEDPGMARVYDGRSGLALHTIYGNEKDRFLGIDVAGVGDMNRDGYPDFAAGTWGYAITVGEERGDYVEVRSGKNFALLGRVVSDLYHDGFGASLAGAGDVNGDGFDDLIVGAFQSPLGPNDAGRAEVWAGRSQYGLVASAPRPGLAGGANAVVLTGARPGAELVLFAGRNLGSTPLRGCPADRALSIRSAVVYARARADESGRASFDVEVGGNQSGTTILLQAVERDTCRISTLESFVWR